MSGMLWAKKNSPNGSDFIEVLKFLVENEGLFFEAYRVQLDPNFHRDDNQIFHLLGTIKDLIRL